MVGSRSRNRGSFVALLVVTMCLIFYLSNPNVSQPYLTLQPKATAEINDQLSMLQTQANEEMEVGVAKQPQLPKASAEIHANLFMLQPQANEEMEVGVAKQPQLPKASAEIHANLFMLQPQANEEMEMEASEQTQFEDLQMLLNTGPPSTESCRMDSCFDYSHCSLNSGFPVYFYTDKELAPLYDTFQLSPVKYDLSERMYGTRNPDHACVFVVAVGEMVGNQNSLYDLESVLHSLPYWKNEGWNHLVVSFTKDNAQEGILQGWAGQTPLASPGFVAGFRDKFDIVIPPSPEPVKGAVWAQLPSLFPIQRKHLVSFWGEYIPTPGEETNQLRELKTTVMSDLQILQKAQGVDLMTSCGNSQSAGWPTDWALCGTAAQRSSQLSQSTFALLLSPLDRSLASTILFQTRLQEALKNGAVPVIVGQMRNRLPFGEIVSWLDITVCFPFPRLRDLIHILSAFSENDIFEYRRLGRFIFETYFSSSEQILLAALTVVRSRLQIPAAPVPEERSSVILSFPGASPNPNFKTDGNTAKPTLRVPSPRFQRNFTHSLEQRMLNRPGYPFFLFPSTPFEPMLPSESKVWGKTGIPSQAFNKDLGGNLPQEQFTLLVNSYKRPYAALAAVARVKGLPCLHKVVVIWVDPEPPSPDLVWPVIDVPVVVVQVNGTSLNVRYLPFDVIETDCVFNLDDDLEISHKYIVNAFKVWRSERDNIVSFKTPTRALAWNTKTNLWEFCEACPYLEYTLALPTMGFFHKMYLYLYSYAMPQAIRDLVTEERNCEDIAMVFLVSHVIRKPGIKVTSDIRIICPGCDQANAISMDTLHFQKRSKCFNFFAKVYGYTPLLFRPRPK